MNINTRFYIKSKRSNKYITVQNNSGIPRIVLFQKSDNSDQLFYMSASDNEAIHIIDVKSKLFLSLCDSSDQKGAPLVLKQQDKANPKSQQFQIHCPQKQEQQQIVLFTFCGKCLDCCQQSTKNGTPIIQWDFHGSDNQKWILIKAN